MTSRSGNPALMIMVSCGWLASGCGRSPIGFTMKSHTDGGPGGAGGTAAATDGSVDRPGGQVDAAADLRDAPPDIARPDLITEHPLATDTMTGTMTDTNTCAVNCSNLAHLRPGVVAACRGVDCIVPPGGCEDGWFHCRGPSTAGCESNLSTATDCGSCNVVCSGFNPECKVINGYHYCGPRCLPPTTDACGFYCTDLQNDISNCGTCNNYCSVLYAGASCIQGKCMVDKCFDGFVDCTAEPGCETQLGTDDNCAACGDKSCGLSNTMFTCSDGARCDAAVCAPGFANCDAASADCEATFAAGTAGCLPHYGDTISLATNGTDIVATAIAPDGSTFLAGGFEGTVDFDPSSARDIRIATDRDAYVTKFNADGSYAWTAVLTGRGVTTLNAIAATSTGAVVVSGSYSDSIDLDPSASVTDTRQTAVVDQTDAYVLELTAAGKLAWGGTLQGSLDGSSSIAGVAVDATDGVYLTGTYNGTVDLDPGAGASPHTAPATGAFLVKLTSAGGFHSARVLDNGNCTVLLAAVTIASDGNVWATGSVDSGPGCALDDRPLDYVRNSIVLVKHDPTNVPLGRWVLGDNGGASAIAAGPAGSIYVAGESASGSLDFDPGPGVVHRSIFPGGGGFILKLDASAGFRWVRVLPDHPISGLAPTPDGGVIGVSDQFGGAFTTRLTTDGAAVWSFDAGGESTYAFQVASRGTRFAIAGSNSGTADIDPTAGVDIIFGEVAYVSRYTF